MSSEDNRINAPFIDTPFCVSRPPPSDSDADPIASTPSLVVSVTTASTDSTISGTYIDDVTTIGSMISVTTGRVAGGGCSVIG